MLDLAIDLATQNVADGGGPFGAVIVAPDGMLVPATNLVTRRSDPTAHAEVQAIRAAGQLLGDFDLSGCTLYTSCAPCPMCLSAVLWSRIPLVHYAASPQDAAAAGFDDATFYAALGTSFSAVDPDSVHLVGHSDASRALLPFEAWTANLDRTDY